MAVPEFWNVRNFNFALLRRTGNKYCFVAIYQFPLCVTFVYTFYRFYLSTFLHLLYGLFQFSDIFICLKCVCSRTWNKSHVITNILLYGTVMFYCIEICLLFTDYSGATVWFRGYWGCVQRGRVRASGRGAWLTWLYTCAEGERLRFGIARARDVGSSLLFFLY